MKKSFIETKYFTVVLHVLIWSTFFLLQILSFQASFSERPVRIEEFQPPNFYSRFIFQSLTIVSLYYLNTLILIPKLLFKSKIVKFIISLILVLVVVVLIDYLYNYLYDFGGRINGKRPPITFFISLFILALSTSIKLAQKWFENETQQKAMIHEKMIAELSALKSQVNPHFLFNTLNGIYSLANAKSDKTAPAVVKLSQLMRYMLDESKQQFVPLVNEIEYINTYIELQKLRLFDNVKIEYDILGSPEGIKIQPLLLIPFIENAFKHGTDSRNNCTIKIKLEIKIDSIQLIVINDVLNVRKDEEESGFGLNNIRRRLELEYPEKHILTTNIENNKFHAKLFISLNK